MAARFPDNKAPNADSSTKEVSRKTLKRTRPRDDLMAKRPKMSDDDIPSPSQVNPSGHERVHATTPAPGPTRDDDDSEDKVSHVPAEPDSSSDSDSAAKEVI